MVSLSIISIKFFLLYDPQFELIFFTDESDLIVEIGAFDVYLVEGEEEDEEDNDQEDAISSVQE
jgi:hypothetical protein